MSLPADIREAAELTADELEIIRALGLEREYLRIQALLLAERQRTARRCVEIAGTYPALVKTSEAHVRGLEGRDIAQAIAREFLEGGK